MSEKPVAVVTGANRGLGLETSRRLAALGYTLILTARREQEGQAAAQSLASAGGDVRFQALDVTDEASVQALAETVRGIGRLDVLVNNAGIVPDPKPGTEEASVFVADLETVRRGMETNALAPLRLCQVLIPLMNGRGRVVNVSSGMGQLDEMILGRSSLPRPESALPCPRKLTPMLRDCASIQPPSTKGAGVLKYTASPPRSRRRSDRGRTDADALPTAASAARAARLPAAGRG